MNTTRSGLMALLGIVLLTATVPAHGRPLTCDLREYRALPGLQAALEADALVVSWQGDRGTPLRIRLAIEDGQPVVRELAAGGPRGSWSVLGRNLAPEFEVTSGVRRVSEQQLQPLRQLGVAITPEVMEREKTMVNHFHIAFTDRLREAGSLDTLVQELPAMKALGINVVALMDFHADKLRPRDPGALRLADQKDYFEAARRHSDDDFLIIPSEEPNAYLGGHYSILTPRPVFWTMVRQPDQPFVEEMAGYGRVYHAGSAADVHEMVEREDGFIWQAHPRTKGSTGYPDAIRDKDYFRSDRFLGAAFKPGMGMDLSERRLCEYRCLDLMDEMNNWISGQGGRPKSLLADVDTYQKGPGDDLYPNFPVNYVRLERVPRHEEDWSPLLKALRAGDYFVTTGEILFHRFAVEGAGARRTAVADLEWTFPLEFVEVVWGDGSATGRQVVSATDHPPFGRHRFAIPFDATGKSWVRFAAWDSAGNGAFVPPVRLPPASALTRSGRVAP